MKLIFKAFLLFISFVLTSCIGTDLLDDPIMGEKITVEKNQIALLTGQKEIIKAVYFDKYGIEKTVNFTYSSSNPQSVTVNNNGEVSALANGSAVIKVSYLNVNAPPININVVANNNDVAVVNINAVVNTLKPGNKTQLNIEAKNLNGDILRGLNVEWFSENTNILTISASGEATAVGIGTAVIYAKVNGIKSNNLNISVSDDKRGEFVSVGGYQAVGSASLKEENGKLVLQFDDNFKTSFALGTFVYLANSINGSMVRSGGIEIAEINTNGAKRFVVTDKYPSVKLLDYRYVVILCKPASLTFGYVDFN